jgi:hypothetical protein
VREESGTLRRWRLLGSGAIPDVLFERGLYWASGRSGVVNLVAAHKWFNLAALKGTRGCHLDAPRGRRDDVGCRNRHREARAWMTAH